MHRDSTGVPSKLRSRRLEVAYRSLPHLARAQACIVSSRSRSPLPGIGHSTTKKAIELPAPLDAAVGFGRARALAVSRQLSFAEALGAVLHFRDHRYLDLAIFAELIGVLRDQRSCDLHGGLSPFAFVLLQSAAVP